MRAPRIIAVIAAGALVAVPAAAGADSGDTSKPRAVLGRVTASDLDAHLLRGTAQAPAGLLDAVHALQTGPGDALAASTKTRAGESTMVSASMTSATATPVFVTPAEDATVGGMTSVSATSFASQVRFTMPSLGFSATVPVSDGTATVQLPTWGAAGAEVLTAADCDETGSCGPVATRRVSVSNPAPVVTSPDTRSTVGTSFPVAATAAGGGVQWRVDGSVVGFDGAAPYQQTIYTDGLGEGTHTLTAQVCNTAGTTCAEAATSGPVEVLVKKKLSPVLAPIAPSPFSPGADGRRDTARVSYKLETTQSVSWRLTKGNTTPVLDKRFLGTKPTGTHAFTFNGKRGNGSYLPSGQYTLHVDTEKTVSGSIIRGHTMRTVILDRTAPRVGSVSASPSTVYPARDGYRDSTRLRGRLSERASSVDVQLFTAGGKHIRTMRLGSRAAGVVAATWNGRSASGKTVPAGSYRYRFVTQDTAGNRTVGAKYVAKVSAKRLVKRSESKKVTAKGSATSVYAGSCSEAVSPGVRGWTGSIGYYSDLHLCSAYEGDDFVASVHSVKLPRAVKYGTVRIDTFGGKSLAEFNDIASLLYLDGSGEVTGTGRVLKSPVATYQGPSVGARYVSPGGRVRWAAATLDGNFYDIRDFTVRYSYYVLR